MFRLSLAGWIVLGLVPLAALAAEDRTPYLIREASPAIRRAWQQIDRSIRNNDKNKKPLPGPYLSRAEIWSLVGDHEDALKDELKALELLYQQSPSLIDQARYLKRIHETLDRLSRLPRAYFPGQAEKYFYLGKTAYFQRDYRTALEDFNEAIRLDPAEAASWLYRALVYKAQGEESKAVRDARVGASLRRAGKTSMNLGVELERVQGCLRSWLNEADKWRPNLGQQGVK